jgi:hypothetical protein
VLWRNWKDAFSGFRVSLFRRQVGEKVIVVGDFNFL